MVIQSPQASPSSFAGGCAGAVNARVAPRTEKAIIASICAGVIPGPSSSQNSLPRRLALPKIEVQP